MTKQQQAILIAVLAGILTYGREWLVLVGVIPFPETTFFDGFPNVLSPVPAVLLVLGFLLRGHIFSAWVAFFLPSLVAHHLNMLLGAGFFPMWPAFLGAHLLLMTALLALMILGGWLGRRYQVAQ